MRRSRGFFATLGLLWLLIATSVGLLRGGHTIVEAFVGAAYFTLLEIVELLRDLRVALTTEEP